jgi:hypothetical protein
MIRGAFFQSKAHFVKIGKAKTFENVRKRSKTFENVPKHSKSWVKYSKIFENI